MPWATTVVHYGILEMEMEMEIEIKIKRSEKIFKEKK